MSSIYVLNYYILNGQVTIDEGSFRNIIYRTPNLGRNRARYVAQIQISSILESSVREVASAFTDLILKYFPDENGVVRVVEDKS